MFKISKLNNYQFDRWHFDQENNANYFHIDYSI